MEYAEEDLDENLSMGEKLKLDFGITFPSVSPNKISTKGTGRKGTSSQITPL